jgi:hypothetical protein
MRKNIKSDESLAFDSMLRYLINKADPDTLLNASNFLLHIYYYKKFALDDENNLPYIPEIYNIEYRETAGTFIASFNNGIEIETNKPLTVKHRIYNMLDEPSPDFNTLEELLDYINSNFKS